MGVVNGIFLNLCQLIYPIIPKLYDLVIQLATIDLFDPNGDGTGLAIRNNIWNNLYIILSVLVLFAIAIKLINAIVNPDVLSDKKNGVKKAYFKAVAAVFLIVLLPIMFNVLQGVQNEIIGKDFIQKIIYGDITETNPGQRLAVETARSFVEMADGVEDPFPGEDQDLNDEAISQILNTLEDNNAHKDDDGEYVKSFNPLLMLVSGVFVVYQLILIVLDVAVRTIKLRILELMVPAIIGGYIFKTEILKSWFKEYIKTFVQVFLLLITITLISLALGLLKSATSEQFTLLVRLLLIFGVLTLAKQIPNLINTIFGTNIKSKGGIKGRAGEMAAVGGLAQQALGALKPLGMGALKLAGLAGLGLAGGIGAAGIGVGAAIGGRQVSKWWKNGGKDTKVGRGARRVGAVAKGIGTGISKGASKKGGLIASTVTGISEGLKAYEATEIGKSLKTEREKTRTNADKNLAKGKFRFGDDKRPKEISELERLKNKGDITADKLNGSKKKAAEENQKRVMSDAKSTYDSTSSVKMRDSDKVLAAQQKVSDAALVSEHMDNVQKKHGDMADKIKSLYTDLEAGGNRELAAKIKGIHGKIMSGGMTLEEAYNSLEDIANDKNNSLKIEDLGGIKSDFGNFKREINAKFTTSNGDVMSINEMMGGTKDKMASFSITEIKGAKDKANEVLATAEAGVNEVVDELNYDDTQKAVVTSVTQNIKSTAKEVALANTAYDETNEKQKEAYESYKTGDVYKDGFINTTTGTSSGSTSSGGSTSNGGSTITPPSPAPSPAPAPTPEPAPASSESPYGPAPDYWGMATGATANTSGPAPDYWEMQANGAPVSKPIDVSSQPTQSTQTTTTNVVNETKTETRTESSGDASYDSSSSSNSGGTGLGAGTTVNATIDTRGIESKLDEINKSVNRSGESVSNAVNEQGKQITSRLDTANTYQKKTSEATQHIKDNLDSSNKPNGEE